ncbi:hypothetical protein [Lysinibacillus xylanilyticus]
MKVVEKILKEEDFIRFVDIVVGAYPGRMGGLQPANKRAAKGTFYAQSKQ